MRTSNFIVSMGLLGFAIGLSPAVSFDGARTPEGFRQACTRFIDVDALEKAHKAEAAAAAANGAVDAELVRLLIDAYNSAKRDEREKITRPTK